MGQPILGSIGMMRAADAFECREYHKKRGELGPPGLLPPSRRAAFPSRLRAISLVIRLSERGEYRALTNQPIINLLRGEKATPPLGR